MLREFNCYRNGFVCVKRDSASAFCVGNFVFAWFICGSKVNLPESKDFYVGQTLFNESNFVVWVKDF